MDKIIKRLTEDGLFANEICLLFVINNDEMYLEYLDKLKIRGKDLETFAYDCCNGCDIEYIKDTLLCISFGLFDLDIVYSNLKSPKPEKLIDNLYANGDAHANRFIRLKREFDNKFKTKSR